MPATASSRLRARPIGACRSSTGWAHLACTVLCVALTGLGCVSTEKRDVEKARDALVACEAEHGIDHPECAELRLRLKDAQARYEKKARELWVCDPTQDQCPAPR